MRYAIVLLSLVALSGCASLEPPLSCAAGEEPMRTAQLFFGQNIGDKLGVSDADFRKFTDEVLTPRFPEGLTVLDGGGQWTGPENKLIREAAKIVVPGPAQGGRRHPTQAGGGASSLCRTLPSGQRDDGQSARLRLVLKPQA